MSFYQRILRRLRGGPVPMAVAVPLASVPAPEPVLPAYTGPAYEGFVEERSTHHVSGWLRYADDTNSKPTFSVELADSGEVLAAGVGNQFRLGEGRERRGYFVQFTRPLSDNERGYVVVRGPDGAPLPDAPYVRPEYQPVMLVAMDIVDNCNLRCPFCLYDYGNTHATNMMTPETLAAAIRFAPYTMDGNFWLSCLHEPSLHPRFTEFMESVPRELRHKLFFTTNLAKRMKQEYFDFLASSGVGHLNISIESRDPALYERMRKGARFRIFSENWDKLIDAYKLGTAPPRLRYIIMVYKSNLAEIPELARYLIEERLADEVQLRFTFDVPYIPREFRETEFLDDADWVILQNSLKFLPADKIVLVLPPQPDVGTAEIAGADDFLPGRYEFKLSWDGRLIVNRYWSVPYDGANEDRVADVNVADIEDPLAFLQSLSA